MATRNHATNKDYGQIEVHYGLVVLLVGSVTNLVRVKAVGLDARGTRNRFEQLYRAHMTLTRIAVEQYGCTEVHTIMIPDWLQL